MIRCRERRHLVAIALIAGALAASTTTASAQWDQPPGTQPPGANAPEPAAPPAQRQQAGDRSISRFYVGVAANVMPGLSLSKEIVGDGLTEYPEAAAIEGMHVFGWQIVFGFRFAEKRLDLQLASGFAGASFAGCESTQGIGGGLTGLYHLSRRGRIEPFLYAAFRAIALFAPEPGAVRLQGDAGGGAALQLGGRNWLRLDAGAGFYVMDYTDTDWTFFIPQTDGAEFSGTSLVFSLAYQRYL